MITMPAGRWSAVHRTGSARSGPPPDQPAASAPLAAPRWRNWLLVAGLLLTAALFLLPIPTSNIEQLSYSQLKSDIAAGQVASVALGPDGSISGQLTNRTMFTSSYPVDLQDPQFAQLLDQHNVQVATQPARTSTWSVLLNLLPLAIIVALFVWSGRATRRQLAGLGGIGRSGARCTTPSEHSAPSGSPRAAPCTSAVRRSKAARTPRRPSG